MGCTQSKPPKPNPSKSQSPKIPQNNQKKPEPHSASKSREVIKVNPKAESNQSSESQEDSKNQDNSGVNKKKNEYKNLSQSNEQSNIQQKKSISKIMDQNDKSKSSVKQNLNSTKKNNANPNEKSVVSQSQEEKKNQVSQKKSTKKNIAIEEQQVSNSKNKPNKSLQGGQLNQKLNNTIQGGQQSYLGMESKVQRRPAHQILQNLQASNQKLNYTTYHKKQQKKSSQSNSKPQFAHNLFYSQKYVSNQNPKPPQIQKQVGDTHSIRKQNFVKKQNAELVEDLDDSMFKSQEKSMKSQVIATEAPLDKSIKQANFAKKNQYFSVLEQKKGFEDRFKNREEKNDISEHSSSIRQEAKTKNQQKTDDFLIQDNDQQGVVRVPFESSSRSPSKRNIESKKDISVSSSRVQQKYLKQLENRIAYQRGQKQLEASMKQENEPSHKKQSKLDTAFFKQSSQKHPRSSQKQNQNSQEKLKQTSMKKKAGPILFSQISFKQDSDCIPDQQVHIKGLQMSIHLNISQNY